MVQWLRLCTSMAGAQVQSGPRELRSCMLRGMAKKGKKEKNDVTLLNYFENYMRKQMQWAWLLKCGLFLINTE